MELALRLWPRCFHKINSVKIKNLRVFEIRAKNSHLKCHFWVKHLFMLSTVLFFLTFYCDQIEFLENVNILTPNTSTANKY